MAKAVIEEQVPEAAADVEQAEPYPSKEELLVDE